MQQDASCIDTGQIVLTMAHQIPDAADAAVSWQDMSCQEAALRLQPCVMLMSWFSARHRRTRRLSTPS